MSNLHRITGSITITMAIKNGNRTRKTHDKKCSGNRHLSAALELLVPKMKLTQAVKATLCMPLKCNKHLPIAMS